MIPSCNETTEYTVPEGVVKINNTSQYNVNLVKITFPESLREISEGAFAMSIGLETVVFAEGIEKIGDAAFSGCLFLKDVVFPASLKELGEYAFTDCYSLEKITFKGNNTQFSDANVGVICSVPADGVSEETWLSFAKKALRPDADADTTFGFMDITAYPDIFAKDSTVFFIHDDEENTVVSYAESYSIPVERMHFYGEWEYDWDKYVRTRKCELCDMTDTEALEKETNGDVEIVAPANPELEFDVDHIEKDGNTFVLVQQTINENLGEEYKVLNVFDINLKNKDGVHVQPNGTVKVKLPLNWEKNGNYIVYRVNDDGSLTDMQAFRQGSHMVFETDHFSIYVIVDTDTTEKEPSTDAPDSSDEETNENPQENKKGFVDYIMEIFEFIQQIINFVKKLLGLL